MDSECSTMEFDEVHQPRSNEDDSKPGNRWGHRHVQALLLFLCFFTNFILRWNLSVAIVAMTNRESSNPNYEEYKWDEPTKSTILSSYFWGYLVSQAPAGALGQFVSPKLLLLATNLVSGILTLIVPLACHYGGWVVLVIIRVAIGLSQGFMVPMTYNLASKWAPPSERNRFVGLSLNGGTLGSTLVFPFCGLLASSNAGWPSIFYVSAGFTLIWVLLWVLLAADSPATHPRISESEKKYIQDSLAHTSESQVSSTPWKDIFTSIPLYALIAAYLGYGWTFAIINTEMPSYINSVLGFNISTNGFLSALPHLSMWILSFPVCWFADYINKTKLLDDSTSRKTFSTIAQAGGGMTLVAIGFVGSNSTAAIALFIITVSFSSFMFSGFNINQLDLAPNYAGVLIGICNGLGNITSILAPLSVGWIITDSKSVEQWREVFAVTAIVGLIGNLIFVIFGTAEVQPWNEPKNSKEETEEK